MNISVLYEDKFVIVLNKESGISAIPGRGEDTNNSLYQIAEKSLNQKLFVVHRIDKDTSGVIIFAKNAASHKCLNSQFEKRLINKKYLALVNGIPDAESVIESPIYEFGSGRMGIDSRGKPSTTKFSIIQKFETTSLLNVTPLTGRRHQIRVHLYSVGFGIMGDRTYGSPRPVGGVERLMLHAHEIEFELPNSSKKRIVAPVSNQWENIISRYS